MQIIFWFSTLLLIYHYIAYPLAVICWSRLGIKGEAYSKDMTAEELPAVALIIAAFNEEKVIAEKIENSLRLDYPKEKLQIIVVCDGSNDNTRKIVEQYEQQGVVCLYQAERKGKSNALNRAVEHAGGQLLLFSDANNEFNTSAIRAMAKHFKNKEVGGVCGVKCIKPDSGRDSSIGDGLYWQYESAIKLAESKLYTITCADGEIFALRKSLYEPIGRSIINDDLELTLSLVRNNYVIKYEPEAMSHELASINVIDDFWVKVRMVAGGYQALAMHFKQLTNPTKAFNWMFLSHKVLRWLAPILLIVTLLSNLALFSYSLFYCMAALTQILFYVLAACGGFAKKKSELPHVFYVPFYFIFMNIAAFLGLVRFLSGSQKVTWNKAAR